MFIGKAIVENNGIHVSITRNTVNSQIQLQYTKPSIISKCLNPPGQNRSRVSFEASFADRTHHVRPEQRLQFLGPHDTQNNLPAPISPPSLEKYHVCAMCMDTILSGSKEVTNEPIKLFCNHIFHLGCIMDWFLESENSAHCPTCRQAFFIVRVPLYVEAG
jgi:hypothetical protein